jgi:23S rRNA (adenine2503-C2)-methyltransferase
MRHCIIYNEDMNTSLALPQADAAATPQPLLSLSIQELAAWLTARNWPRFHAPSLRRWLLERRAEDFTTMTDLPKKLRTELEEAFVPLGTAVATSQQAHDGTRKLLLKMWDGEAIECVMIPEQDRRTACISTQVGCGMACVFCASGLNGVLRNLHAGEILEQLLRLRNALPPQERLNHIVVMGMGEPLANLDHLLDALAEATSPRGLGLGARNITISTVGLPVKIRRLADLKKQYHLAISLHAPNDELRNRIVPTNTGLAEIMASADYFHEQTGRQVTYEYVLLRDINDAPEHAQELARLLQGRHAHINLIPFNEVEDLSYRRPTDEALKAFVNCLRGAGLSVKVRKRKGSEIDAACGQLRRRMAGAAVEKAGAMV